MELHSLFPIAADLAIKFPDGTDTGITFRVVGQDSKAFRDVVKRVTPSLMGKEDKLDVELLDKQGAELAAACITGWDGLTENGHPVVYSHSKAVELMAMPELAFIRQQVEGFVSKRTNFFRQSTQTA